MVHPNLHPNEVTPLKASKYVRSIHFSSHSYVFEGDSNVLRNSARPHRFVGERRLVVVDGVHGLLEVEVAEVVVEALDHEPAEGEDHQEWAQDQEQNGLDRKYNN